MSWQLCGKYFIAIVSHPTCFLPHHWNTDSKQMAWSSVKDIQAKKTSTKLISNHHYYIRLENSMKHETFLSNFSWTKQTFMKGILCASKWMRNGICFLRACLIEIKAILPCQPTVKTKTKVSEFIIKEKGNQETIWVSLVIQ